MYIKSFMLVCAFGVAMTIGMASNRFIVESENPDTITLNTITLNTKTLDTKTDEKYNESDQDNSEVEQELNSAQEKDNSQQTDKLSPNSTSGTEPQKGARLNSVHFGLSHAEMQFKEACTACHQSNDSHDNQFSPYFLGFFPNKDSKEKNEVDVAFLGVNASDVPSAVRSHLRLEEDNGAIVNHVVDESPAYHCGIEKHDVLVAVDNQPVKGEKSLLDLIRSRSPGTKIVVQYVRAGKKESINLVLGKQKTARILRSFQINGCEAQLTSATNCQSCHAIESK